MQSPMSRVTATISAVALPALLLADILAVAQPAAAQQSFGNFFTYQPSHQRRYAKKRPAAPRTETAAKPVGKDGKKEAEKKSLQQPVSIVVSLADQHATVYDANGVVTRTRVSTGQAGHRTPTGVFSVIGKERWHRSNIYSSAPMPWMQRITWSGVALHAGVVPGYPASHGCIRLPAGFAPQLYGMTRMGARVVVTPRDVQPVAFAHAALPVPKMHEAPAIPASPEHQANGAAVELASMDTAAVPAGEGAAPAAGAPKMLNPIAYAAALKQRAVADKAAAELAAKNALAAAQAAGAEARQAAEDVAKAQDALKAAEDRLAAIAAPAADNTAAGGAADKAAAETAVAQAQKALAEARAAEAAKSPAAFAAVETYKHAVEAAEAASDLVEEADRRREQVSVLISRKEGRIFIRQNWKEVWEAPITIRDPERPLGTHVYSAVEAAPDGASLRWTAISMPAERADSAPRRGRGKDKDDDAEASEADVQPETAAGALERIELPDGARERIAELLWVGGSLIISDQPRSYEMSEDATDFIVLTR